jgi:vacuolar-type H+-ATPase subunit C/Vma6
MPPAPAQRPPYVAREYAYATGCVKVRECSVLRREWFEKLADARDGGEAAAMLREVSYLEAPAEPGLSPGTIERLTAAGRRAVHRFLSRISPDPYYANLLYAHFDFARTRRALAAEATKKPHEPGGPGFFLGGGEPFPEPFAAQLSELAEKLSHDFDLAAFDEAADHAFYAWFVAEAQASGIELLSALARRIVDAENIRLLLRHRALYGTPSFADFLPGGEIPADRIAKLYPRDERDLAAFLQETPFAGAEIALSGEPHAASAAEKHIDDGVTSAARPARRAGAGVEALLGYAMGMEIELRNIQAVASGSAAKVPADLLKRRIREPYV